MHGQKNIKTCKEGCDQDRYNSLGKMPYIRREECGRKLRRRFGKTSRDLAA